MGDGVVILLFVPSPSRAGTLPFPPQIRDDDYGHGAFEFSTDSGGLLWMDNNTIRYNPIILCLHIGRSGQASRQPQTRRGRGLVWAAFASMSRAVAGASTFQPPILSYHGKQATYRGETVVSAVDRPSQVLSALAIHLPKEHEAMVKCGVAFFAQVVGGG